MTGPLTTVLLTQHEITALAVAVAKSVDPGSRPTSAAEASAVVWRHAAAAGQPLCSLATMFAEVAEPAGYTCPVCGATSYHPKDVEQGYCGRCHAWTGESVS